MTAIRKVGLLGGGVIGAGWAARMVLGGVDVAVCDPDDAAAPRIAAAIEAARLALSRLTLAPLPPPGTWRMAARVEDAAEGADFVQESVPDDVALKAALLARAERAVRDDAVIASSTAGLAPSSLQSGLRHPGRFVIGCPCDPVYLMPLVELCGGARTDAAALDAAAAFYRALGLRPVRRHADAAGSIAARLATALRQEAARLHAEGMAGADEIAAALRLGPGLRAPFAGIGAARRDACLVAVTQALKVHDEGAGAVLAAHERNLWHARGRAAAAAAETVPAAPLDLFSGRVEPGWIDYNGHMNESRYLQVFSQAGDVLLGMIGADADYVARGHSYYTAETHLRHLRETPPDAPFRVTLQILGADEKRLHFWQEMYRLGEDAPVATCEQMVLHVHAATGRVCPALPEIRARLAPIVAAHAALPRPPGAGRAIGMPARR